MPRRNLAILFNCAEVGKDFTDFELIDNLCRLILEQEKFLSLQDSLLGLLVFICCKRSLLVVCSTQTGKSFFIVDNSTLKCVGSAIPIGEGGPHSDWHCKEVFGVDQT